MRKMWSRRLGAARAGSGWTAASGRDLERTECREWAQSGRSVHDENWPIPDRQVWSRPGWKQPYAIPAIIALSAVRLV
jgi:hypothetical protein